MKKNKACMETSGGDAWRGLCVNTRAQLGYNLFLIPKGDLSRPITGSHHATPHVTQSAFVRAPVCVCARACAWGERAREGGATKVLQSRSVPLLIRVCSQKMVAGMR